jgi:6-phosphogluconolactonase
VTHQAKLYNLNLAEWLSSVLFTIQQSIGAMKTGIDSNTEKPSSPQVHILLSGGATPIPVYQKFCELDLPWSNIHFWLADERCVPKSHPDSNEKSIKEALGNKILNQATFHSIPETYPIESARSYSEMLKGIADFDLSILGIGEDGHTASLFPGYDLGASPNSPDAIPVLNSPKPPKEWVSLSLNRINRSKRVIFLVTGEKKKEIVDAVSNRDPKYPASLVQGTDSTEIFYSP